MNYKSVFSSEKNIALAVKEIKQKASDITNPKLVVYFASANYSHDEISKAMGDAFPGVHTVGCSSAGEMTDKGMISESIVAMIFGKSSLKSLQIEVLQNISTDKTTVKKAFASFEKNTGVPMSKLSPDHFVGFMMIDGMSYCEEEINDHIGNLTNVPFVGGSAADMFAFAETFVYANGKAYTDAAVLVLMEPTNGFGILKTQSLDVLNKETTVTKISTEDQRQVIEFDNRPAAEVYAEMIGVTLENLPNAIFGHPMGLVFDKDNFFVRSPIRINDDKTVNFNCSIKEGMSLSPLEARDIVVQTRKDVEKIKSEYSAVIDFNCGFRVIELRMKKQEQDYVDIFKGLTTIGIASFGESYIGHMGQTSTMLLLK